MARNDPGFSCRFEAVPSDGVATLPETALREFEGAGDRLQRPGAFEGGAVVAESQAFSELTGFHTQGGETIDRGVVKRAAEAATAGRARALANCHGRGSSDYVSLGAFLRVCADEGLALKVDAFMGRRRGA